MANRALNHLRSLSIDELAMKYVLMTSIVENPRVQLYSSKDVYQELYRRCCQNNMDDIGQIALEIHLEKARTILKMVDAN